MAGESGSGHWEVRVDNAMLQNLRYLDKHLAIPVLEFMQVRGAVDEAALLRMKEGLLRQTNMVDFAIDVHQSLHGSSEAPAELTQQRTQVLDKLNELQSQAQNIVDCLSNPSLVSQLRGDKHANLKLLSDEHGIGTADIECLYRYARFQYECGNYEAASELLYHYRSLCTNPEHNFSALWGKFASDILMQDWDSALDDIKRLREAIDTKQHENAQQQLQQQVWLMHWSLFVYFNHERGRESLIDLFMQERYLNAIQASVSHLLRYLAVAAVTSKRGQNVVKELVSVLGNDRSDLWSDPAAAFVHALFADCDFEKAEHKLKECETLLENDFFTVGCKQDFLECARLFVLERYCTIHKALSLQTLATKLGISEDDAERWVISLIKQGRLNATVDSENGHIKMSEKRQSVFEQVREKARPIAERTQNLVMALNSSQLQT